VFTGPKVHGTKEKGHGERKERQRLAESTPDILFLVMRETKKKGGGNAREKITYGGRTWCKLSLTVSRGVQLCILEGRHKHCGELTK